ncbi:MAG: DUF255 domain-containing protein [Candidatus Nanopelagicales bacterium]
MSTARSVRMKYSPNCCWTGFAARRRDVPVLLSVGYAACHWCHERR